MTEVFEICVQTTFSAAHFLKGYRGDCARMHGHNWTVVVYIKCYGLNEIGVGIDFRDIKQTMNDIVKDFDHHNLNELAIFENMNPTSENIAKHIYGKLSALINSDTVKVSKVKVSESPKTSASYWEE
jgi:6-pyruvoyltetrahydropterin/6-carboxytetrahydropterin synthase